MAQSIQNVEMIKEAFTAEAELQVTQTLKKAFKQKNPSERSY